MVNNSMKFIMNWKMYREATRIEPLRAVNYEERRIILSLST
jgi:hypothetical protein